MKSFHRNCRFAMTLLELIIVIGIIAILLGLLLAGISKVREAAIMTQSKNNLRQIALGVESFASVHNDFLPTIDGGSFVNDEISLFQAILPFMEQGNVTAISSPASNTFPIIKTFVSPADPTAAEGIANNEGICSYAANAQVFQDNRRMTTTFVDGASCTIIFAEHYSYNCDGTNFLYWERSGDYSRRATFADGTDVNPITKGKPPVTMPSNAGYTFQTRPSLADCSYIVAQTPHPSGMLVALGDGSIRTLSPNMSEAIYWAAVTPAGGEILGGDW